MAFCAVRSCKNFRKKTLKLGLKVTYHQFPKEENLKAAWIEGTGQDWNWMPTPKASFICSDHFEPESYEVTGGVRRIKPNSVPTLKLCPRPSPRPPPIPPLQDITEMGDLDRLEHELLKSHSQYELLQKQLSKSNPLDQLWLNDDLNNAQVDVPVLKQQLKLLAKEKESLQSLLALRDKRIAFQKKEIARLKHSITLIRAESILDNLQHFAELPTRSKDK